MAATDETLLQADGLTMEFAVRGRVAPGSRRVVRAVDGIGFSIAAGETLGLVGESGSGKTTVGRLLLGYYRPTAGSVRIQGRDISRLGRRGAREARRGIQLVFQDAYASLNPRMTVRGLLDEPLKVAVGVRDRSERHERVGSLLASVGLGPQIAARYPRELSGGQRQRVAIARALSVDPWLVVCDEPVSGLDVSMQAHVVSLLERLQAERGVAYLFVSHDLAVVRRMADRVAVMYLGRIVEMADRDRLYGDAVHPYTQALLSAVPEPEVRRRGGRGRIRLLGDPPDPTRMPTGCRFRDRCRFATDLCAAEEPALTRAGDGHEVACHHWELAAADRAIRIHQGG